MSTLHQDPALLAAEREEKEARLHAYLRENHLDALVLARAENIAWLTGGAETRIVTTQETGAALLLYTAEGRKVVVTGVSEARRIAEEELAGQGWELVVHPWDEDPTPRLQSLLKGRRAAADGPWWPWLPPAPAFARLRYRLTPAEVQRLRWLAARTGAAVAQACRAHQPGESELQALARVHAALAADGITPAVVLVAGDDRVWRYRHPLPTTRPVERYLMVVLVAAKWGLHAAATRLVHFGPLPAELEHKQAAVAAVDRTLIEATRPGVPVKEVFAEGLRAYAAAGFPEEWRLHHQGGAIGYAPREYLATAESTEVVLENQAFAWNPSITGAKSEDTILITPDGTEVLTAVPDWPLIDGRPAILVR
ncbi:MAG TPA: M24 family metallopeptidase [Symbiobacteriaceae bacterium]